LTKLPGSKGKMMEKKELTHDIPILVLQNYLPDAIDFALNTG
jgi:hypothetical protein